MQVRGGKRRERGRKDVVEWSESSRFQEPLGQNEMTRFHLAASRRQWIEHGPDRHGFIQNTTELGHCCRLVKHVIIPSLALIVHTRYTYM
jgi:hypothetical protein